VVAVSALLLAAALSAQAFLVQEYVIEQ